MVNHLLKRLALLIPTLWLVTVLVFFLFKWIGKDAVEIKLGTNPESTSMNSDESYRIIQKQLGLDKPVFYFGIDHRNAIDSLFRYPQKEHKAFLKRFAKHFESHSVESFFQTWYELKTSVYQVGIPNIQHRQLIYAWRDVLDSEDAIQLKERTSLFLLQAKYRMNTRELAAAFEHLQANPVSQWTVQLPKITWYGLDNQYHQWLIGILEGDFGHSLVTGEPVSEGIGKRFKWTLLFGLSAMLLSFVLVFGITLIRFYLNSTLLDKVIQTGLYVLFSMPVFWLAALLIAFFAGYLRWLPVYGITDSDGAFDPLGMVLPLFCWIYPALAYLYKQLNGDILFYLNADFARTARAKGLSEYAVKRKHVLKNTLLPIITVFGSMLPMVIGGSVVIEVIFALPGLGKYLYDAVLNNDYYVVMTGVLFTGFLTIVGHLLADLLYTWADPRLKHRST